MKKNISAMPKYFQLKGGQRVLAVVGLRRVTEEGREGEVRWMGGNERDH